jgi:hypothetical protein
MPSKLTSLNAFICEKVLGEVDGVFSAIRLVEVFNVVIVPDIPREKQGPSMVLFVSGKLPLGDEDEHKLEFSLLRPNGEIKIIDGPPKGKMPSSFPGFPGGFGVALQLTVVSTQLGLHHFVIKFDDVELRRVPFILQLPPNASSQLQQ